MKYYESLYAAKDYVDWYNSNIYEFKDRMFMKKLISGRYRISVRTLERTLKELYTLDQYKHRYSKIDLRHLPGN